MRGVAPKDLRRGKGSCVADGNEYSPELEVRPVVLGLRHTERVDAVPESSPSTLSSDPLEARSRESGALDAKAESVRFGRTATTVASGRCDWQGPGTGRARAAVTAASGWNDWYIGVKDRNAEGAEMAAMNSTFAYNDLGAGLDAIDPRPLMIIER